MSFSPLFSASSIISSSFPDWKNGGFTWRWRCWGQHHWASASCWRDFSCRRLISPAKSFRKTGMKTTHQIRRTWVDGHESITTGHLAFDIMGENGALLIRCRNEVTGWRRFFRTHPIFEDAAGTKLAAIELPRFAGGDFTLHLPDGREERISEKTPLPTGLAPELLHAVECFCDMWFKTAAGDNDCSD